MTATEKSNASVIELNRDNAHVQDVITDCAVALSGIGEALAFRTAVYPDDMLEFLAEGAEHYAAQLRSLIDSE